MRTYKGELSYMVACDLIRIWHEVVQCHCRRRKGEETYASRYADEAVEWVDAVEVE